MFNLIPIQLICILRCSAKYMEQALITLKNGRAATAGNTILDGINLTINKGECWAVTGPSGSGKTALLNILAGNLPLNSGTINYHFNREQGNHKPVALVSLKHHFKDASNSAAFYYQQRFNSADAETTVTVSDYLAAIRPAAMLNPQWTPALIINKFQLDDLLGKHLLMLSNGETRRLLIAAALLKNPAVLLLDNPFSGLDAGLRTIFGSLFQEIAASGISLVLTVPAKHIPSFVSHTAALHSGRLIFAGKKSAWRPADIVPDAKPDINGEDIARLFNSQSTGSYRSIINMNKVNVAYGTVQVLNNISWQVKPGERWALLGPNGAGKSTLLSLVNGDNPQAYANDIVLFDRQRGTGESIWDIKKKIGYVSPELYQYFPADQLCSQVIESGFHDTLGLFRPVQASRQEHILNWMKLLHMEQYAHRLFKNIPAGAQRLCLLARALVKSPPLLILDEPCQGLDEEQQQNFGQIIDAVCSLLPVTLVYVTHYMNELPGSIQHTLRLDKGKVISVS